MNRVVTDQGTPVASLPAGWNWESVGEAVPAQAVHYLRYNHQVRYVVFQVGAQWGAKHTPDGIGARSQAVFARTFPDAESAKHACEEAASGKPEDIPTEDAPPGPVTGPGGALKD